MKQHRPFELQEYNPTWKDRFFKVAERLRPIFGSNLVAIEHIGSTSVVDMMAKPQIDVLVIVHDLSRVPGYRTELEKIGMTLQGRGYVADDDEYITEDSQAGKRLTSIHTFQVGNPKINNYLVFRDYLQTHPNERDLYAQAKIQSYSQHHDEYAEYERGKRDVLTAILQRATQWGAEQPERFHGNK